MALNNNKYQANLNWDSLGKAIDQQSQNYQCYQHKKKDNEVEQAGAQESATQDVRDVPGKAIASGHNKVKL